MPLFIEDVGDYYDKINGVAWDFPEDNIPVYKIGKYPYKATSRKNAEILASYRTQINQLCKNIEKNRHEWFHWTWNQEYLDGVDVFLGLHNEYHWSPDELPEPFSSIAQSSKTSRYLLSEIPKGTKFSGLNKPKMRYLVQSEPPVGKDSQGRALYRDIFLDLSTQNHHFGSRESNLKNLIIHELAHSLCNHIQWRPDDHKNDFQWAENLIRYYWPNDH